MPEHAAIHTATTSKALEEVYVGLAGLNSLPAHPAHQYRAHHLHAVLTSTCSQFTVPVHRWPGHHVQRHFWSFWPLVFGFLAFLAFWPFLRFLLRGLLWGRCDKDRFCTK